ncbi:annexin D2 [Exaiptasia diaphana]|uniref:Annexin n=1 Tax=Exaiptasia diaphana TaxID=2652724 RepID=A0A913YC07_EXADI|nr:annexin D2 [Exaiptasia diaphana]KXJ19116.1 Annexin D2 [Exaiptasia diaphana]
MGCSESIQSGAYINVHLRKATVRDWDIEAGRIHRAVKSFRVNGEDIITLLAHYKNRGRQRIRASYKKVYEEDLLSVLEDELSIGYKEAAQALLYRPEVYDSKSLHEAIKDNDNDTLTEIICSRKAYEIEKIKEEYEDEFCHSLEHDLLGIDDKDLCELLIKFCTVNIDGERSKADRVVAQERAIRLQSYGDLVELLCEPLGRNQLKATFEEFETLYFQTMDRYIDNEYKDKSVDFQKALKAYVCCTISPPTFFSMAMTKALDKLSRHKDLLRIVVTRSETDLYYIMKEFLSSNSIQLTKAISKKLMRWYVQPLKIILEIRGQYKESAIRM